MIEGMRMLVVCALAAFAVPARADERVERFERRWPAMPDSHQLTDDQRLVEHLNDLGNHFGHHVDVLSHDLVAMHFDARANRARLRLGGGDVRYLQFRVDTRWYFADNLAHVDTRIDLGIAGHVLHVQLPEMDLSRDSYHGVQLVQLNVPLLQRRF
jgi:hypothetical protein